MRPLLALLLLALLAAPAAARPIEVGRSFPHGVLYLLESLREEPHHSQQLRKVFLERHPLAPEEAEALAGYRALMERKHTRAGAPNLDQALELLSVDAPDVDGLLERAAGVLEPPDLAALERALRAFEAPYREAVWLPCQEDLDRQVAEVQAGFDRTEAPRRLDQVAAFMQSRWPEDRPLRVLLTPIPKVPGVKILVYGHSNGPLQVSEAPTGAPQKHAPPVLFHEMCHALWRERADPERLETWFRSHPLALQQLDEALATALGNAWFARLLTGSLPEGPWYENPSIDGYARALFPLVEQALDQGTPFDEAFATRAAAAFEKAFPDAWRQPDLVTARMLLLADDREDLALAGIQELSRAVQLRQCYASSPLASKEAGQQFSGMAGGMVVFLLAPKDLPGLARFGVGREDRTAMALRRGSFVWARWTGDRWLVVSVAPTPAERRAALVSFLQQDRLTEGFAAPAP